MSSSRTYRLAIRRFAALALAMLLVSPSLAFAQSEAGAPFVSQTRTELQAELQAAFAETDEPVGNGDGIYISSATSDLQGLNPFLVESDPSFSVVGLIFDSLFGSDPRTGEPSAGGLTDYYEISADRLTYTFHLNQDATWHDGVDVTADDVVFSLDALADEATGSVYTGSFTSTVASYRAVDEHTVEIVAYEPRFTVLYDLGGLYIVPKHIWESVPHADWRADPGATGEDPSRVIGSGAFKFESWTPGQEVKLVRNEAYFDIPSNYSEYIFRIYPDSESEFNAFLDGDLDVIGLEASQVETVQGVEGLNYTTYPARGFTYYEFNLNSDVRTKFLDPKVRQAFMWALDRESIVRDIRLGYGEVANGTHPSASYAYAPDRMNTTYTYDPDKAIALLAEAGWTDTDGDGIVDKDGEAMTVEFLYPSGSAESDTMVAYMQDAWKAVGIDMQPQALEFSALIEATTTNLEWDMAMYGFSWDATFVQDAMFACDQYQVGFNDMKYCNEELDALFDQIELEFDVEKRVDLMVQAANIVNDEQPIGVLYFGVSIAAWSPRIHNYNPGTWGNQSHLGTWVDAD
jgi:peptide/nickel transport system substrate-binding protein